MSVSSKLCVVFFIVEPTKPWVIAIAVIIPIVIILIIVVIIVLMKYRKDDGGMDEYSPESSVHSHPIGNNNHVYNHSRPNTLQRNRAGSQGPAPPTRNQSIYTPGSVKRDQSFNSQYAPQSVSRQQSFNNGPLTSVSRQQSFSSRPYDDDRRSQNYYAAQPSDSESENSRRPIYNNRPTNSDYVPMYARMHPNNNQERY